MIEARLIYLAGPIWEQDDTCIRWREAAAKILQRKKIMCLKPTDADYRGRETHPGLATKIVEKDKRDIVWCDTILAKCDFPSFGTAMEIMFAWSLQKQIIIVTNSQSPWIRYHATHIFPTVDEALKDMRYREFNPGLT